MIMIKREKEREMRIERDDESVGARNRYMSRRVCERDEDFMDMEYPFTGILFFPK